LAATTATHTATVSGNRQGIQLYNAEKAAFVGSVPLCDAPGIDCSPVVTDLLSLPNGNLLVCHIHRDVKKITRSAQRRAKQASSGSASSSSNAPGSPSLTPPGANQHGLTIVSEIQITFSYVSSEYSGSTSLIHEWEMEAHRPNSLTLVDERCVACVMLDGSINVRHIDTGDLLRIFKPDFPLDVTLHITPLKPAHLAISADQEITGSPHVQIWELGGASPRCVQTLYGPVTQPPPAAPPLPAAADSAAADPEPKRCMRVVAALPSGDLLTVSAGDAQPVCLYSQVV
jgi:hypothetical protein